MINKKVAVVYDWATHKRGGAERVLKTLSEIFPQSDLFTSVYNLQEADWAKSFNKVQTSFLQKIPGRLKYARFWGVLMGLAFEQFDFDNYDTVISVTSWPAKAIVTKPETRHICYCLTPPRYIWQQRFSSGFRYLLSSKLRYFDFFYAQRPDRMVTISNYTAKRIKKFYQRDAEVIYPGVDTKKFKVSDKQSAINRGKYYLFIARLVEYKRADLAIKSFNQLGFKLKIVGTGRQEQALKKLADENIEFLGNVSENKLISLYQNAQALIMPQEEDFGLAALEAQACGTPVIAFKRGGAVETVVENKTGLFFRKQKPESLIKAVKKFKKLKFHPQTCRKNALRFSLEKFKRQISATIVRDI